MKNVLELTTNRHAKAHFNRLDVENGPGDLFGHTAVCDSSFGGRMIVFSGSDPKGMFAGNVWILNLEEMKWSCVSGEDSPSGRHFHSAVFYDGNMWVFGGSSNGIYQDLSMFNCSSLKWSSVTGRGDIPSPRYGHCCVVNNDTMYVFGGYDKNGFACNDLFEFDFGSLTWSKPVISGVVPQEAYHHTAVVYKGSMYSFGGYRKNYNEILEFRFATKSWSFLQTSGNAPMPRWGHSAIVYGNCMYVVGGRDRVTNFADCYCFNFDTNVWKKIECVGMEGRFFSSAILFNDCLYLFGGRNIHSFCFNDTLGHCLKEWNPESDESIVEDLQGLVGDPEFADLVFIVPNEKEEKDDKRSDKITIPKEFEGLKRIYGHRNIICCRSSALKTMITSQMREGQSGCIALRETNSSVVHSLLLYIYTDTLNVDSFENLIGLLKLSDQWQLFHLKLLCQEKMLKYLDSTNAVRMLQIAHEFDAPFLFDHVRVYCNKNKNVSLDALSPVLRSAITVTSPPMSPKRDHYFK